MRKHPKGSLPRFKLAPTTDEMLEMLTLEDIPGEMREVAETIGMDAFIELARYYGGDSMYVMQPEKLVTPVRHRLIRLEFTGDNHKELAQKWGFTPRRIYQIVGDANGK
ncbi:hypothetical protein LJC64_02830 [Ruminococcaceae bacterium OttesenSCG-928-A11]|nr:hypothetical protein [Ruminococcaceae bacterium OttesenSCG-928-A11]